MTSAKHVPLKPRWSKGGYFMTGKKKSIIQIVFLCVLFVAAAGVTYLSLSWDSLFRPSGSSISFPDGTVSAHSEIKYLTVDDICYETIKMDFPDQAAAKELYKIESWANNYEYNPELLLMRWNLSVTYILADGKTVERSYQKCDWDEVIADFVKTHEQYVTKKQKLAS